MEGSLCPIGCISQKSGAEPGYGVSSSTRSVLLGAVSYQDSDTDHLAPPPTGSSASRGVQNIKKVFVEIKFN
jgi:hypothetical protein